MNFTNEQLAKAKAAKSVEELLALAKENGTELTEDEAKKFFADLHKEGEIADEELDNVAGGSQCEDGSSYSSDPPYRLITTWGNSCDGYVYNGKDIFDNGTCYACKYLYPGGGLRYYCDLRKIDDDPYK